MYEAQRVPAGCDSGLRDRVSLYGSSLAREYGSVASTSNWTVEGMANKQGVRVDIGRSKGADTIGLGARKAVPDDDDLEKEEGNMSDLEGSPKRGRDPGGDDGAAKRRGRERGAQMASAGGLDIDQMEKLLTSHTERIMKAQKQNLDGMMALFEQRTNDRLDSVPGKGRNSRS